MVNVYEEISLPSAITDYYGQVYPLKEEETTYKYILLYTFHAKFRGFELQNFIEQTTNDQVDNISLFSDVQGKPIGISVIQFTYPVSHSTIVKILQKPFHGIQMQARAFSTQTEYEKFMAFHSLERLDYIHFTKGKHTPLIYVQNFKGDSNDIKDLFKTVGNIQLVRTQTINIGTLFILYFEHEDEALKACKVFHEFTSQQQTTPLIVKPMYKNASTQYFAVTGLENIETVNQLCTMYGSVSTIKPWKGNGLPVFYVFMENIEESQAACALLNGKNNNETKIRTYFITFDRFSSV